SGEVGDLLTHLSGVVETMSTLLKDVTNASREQHKGITQISGVMSQMDAIVQANATDAEASAASGTKLASHAESLHRVVWALKRIVTGGAALRPRIVAAGGEGNLQVLARPTLASTGRSLGRFEMERSAPVVAEVMPGGRGQGDGLLIHTRSLSRSH